MKNPRQATLLATELQKLLGIYEEMRGETNPERIQQKAMQRIQEMNEEEKKEYGKKVMKTYQEYAPSFLESLEKEFPWYLRYHWLVIIFLVLVSTGVSFLVGYLLEPVEEAKY